ncbi:MAG: esterase/lipase family protein [Candidatus Odinarchaeota archaeon]
MKLQKIVYELVEEKDTALLSRHTLESPVNKKPVLFIHGIGSSTEVWFRHHDSLGTRLLELNEKKRLYSIWGLQLRQATHGDIVVMAHGDLWAALETIFEESGGKKTRIISHSMGGIVTRYFTSQKVEHPYPNNFISGTIDEVDLLAVPNHGVVEEGTALSTTLGKLKKRINRVFMNPEEEKTTHDYGLAWLQLMKQSTLMEELNRGGKCLNPEIKWKNAVALYDKIVPVWSAKFDENVDKLQCSEFEQKFFEADHMNYPVIPELASRINKVLKDLPDFAKVILEFNYPAIHRSSEVFDWLFGENQS